MNTENPAAWGRITAGRVLFEFNLHHWHVCLKGASFPYELRESAHAALSYRQPGVRKGLG